MATSKYTSDGSSLEVTQRYSEDLFDFLWCPVCGSREFHHIVFEGVFCEACNTQVEIKQAQDKAGTDEAVLVTFSNETTWNLHKDSRRELPEGTVSLKVIGGPGAREIDMWHPSPDDFWEPVQPGEDLTDEDSDED
ncbi:DUF7567 family protein [Halorhabdus rudnickae]|uniref:DUF7567 family protein n=1 Tax=Halorhabdus rudnickae TaxID=1775544 RepID=UPI0010837AF2|nr:hypothetical protein [Halorhabdus rudnickae]